MICAEYVWTALIGLLALGVDREPAVAASEPRPLLEAPLSVEQSKAAALRAAFESKAVVTRTFEISWEYHYGLYLMRPDDREKIVGLHFANEELRYEFEDYLQAWAVYGPDDKIPNRVLKRVRNRTRTFCTCVGVEFEILGSKEFLVRSATLYDK